MNRVQWHNPEYSSNHNIANTTQTEAHLPPISVRDPGIRHIATILTLVIAVVYGLLHCPHPQQGPHVSSGVLHMGHPISGSLFLYLDRMFLNPLEM